MKLKFSIKIFILFQEYICRSEMNSAKSILPNFPVERFFCLH